MGQAELVRRAQGGDREARRAEYPRHHVSRIRLRPRVLSPDSASQQFSRPAESGRRRLASQAHSLMTPTRKRITSTMMITPTIAMPPLR
jgi:hypothetical protein